MAFIEHPPPGSWRGSPFTAGQRYRVVKAAPSYVGKLVPGEVVEFVGAYYSRYANLSIYAFRNGRSEERTWLLGDDEPLEVWSGVF